ncbi:hypothetical protein SpCBS45565_g08495 [Spizellomyces sp. 'palustris']|nr:hypothetical protein SpCBS45565_g08495 [Spizellomyces sp. 'palustris']
MTYMPPGNSVHGFRPDAILCFVDYLTNRTILVPTLQTSSARNLAQTYLSQVYKNVGASRIFITDHDPKALSDFFEAFCKVLGTKHEFASARHQQMDGKCERTIRTVKSIYRPYLNYAADNWPQHLPLLEFALNNTLNRHGLTPFEADIGRMPSQADGVITSPELRTMKPIDRNDIEDIEKAMDEIAVIVQHRMKKSQDKYAEHYDKGHVAIAFAIGDQVLLNRKGIEVDISLRKPAKLGASWIGPYTVNTKGPHPDTYELNLRDTCLSALYPIFHVNVLKKYEDPLSHRYRTIVAPPPPVHITGVPKYEIEEIIDQ